MSASVSTLPRPRFALRRWQILLVGWTVPVALIGAYIATNVVATTGQRDLKARWDSAVARGRLDPGALAAQTWAAGEPVARIAIPAIGLDVVVVEGRRGNEKADGDAERRAPVHLPSSVLPGTTGPSVVTGGRFGYGNFFAGLDRLRSGDEIFVENLAGIVRMTVTSIEVVPASRLRPASDATVARLDLLTSTRAWSDGERLVVHAEASRVENLR